MKLLAIGGCGGMGQFAVRTALTYDFIKMITIADINLKMAETFSNDCGSKTRPSQLNIEDTSALGRHLSEHDVVLTTAGPYFRYGVPVLKAAIHSGCHYIDICDDWEPTLEMLDLHDEAEKAGVTAIIGMGASPGLSNMLALKAMSALDRTESLITGWGQGRHSLDDILESQEGMSYGAAYEHWFHQLSGSIRIRQNSQYADVSPFKEILVDLPGVGVTRTYSLGHPEPLTIPRYRPEIASSMNVMDFDFSLIEIIRWIAGQIDQEKFSLKDAADFFMAIEKKGLKHLIFSRAFPSMIKGLWRTIVQRRTPLPTIFSLAIGEKGGKPTSAGSWLKGMPWGGMSNENMGAATGIPAAAVLKLFHQNKIRRHGVFAPEGIINPDDLFDILAPLCTPSFQEGEDMVEISIKQ